jgi:cell division protein FtsA
MRMEEIIDAVMFEIENSGCLDKLSAGVVLTGGGALLKHVAQLVRFHTGLDVRIGYPSEYLAGDLDTEINKPQYATSVGLLLKAWELLNVTDEKKLTEKRKSVEIEEEDDTDAMLAEAGENRVGSSIIAAFKKKITDIFEEKGANMD